ncbi:MAG TPA: amidohydrolase/deacetylase family metallohydrolase [Methylomirabilota bacterium]|jgi:dihydroorotase|nr:amidohydrolase/deacetylase family metallohydrolase [Methylomirabilota bacterium]
MGRPTYRSELGAKRPPRFDLVLRRGRVLDPGRGVDGVLDVGIADGRIASVEPIIERGAARRVVDARGKLVIPGMIDTHAHVYEHVTGSFGLNPDLVGVRAGVTTVVDQGGAGPLTIDGFRKFISEPAATRVLAFVSNYLVGGLVGHRYTALYGPSGIDVRETVRAIEHNRDLVKGIKAHGEVGGYSRWGVEPLRLAKQASRQGGVPVYVHLGRLWSDADGMRIDPDTVVPEVVPLLAPGDILAHPFTKNAGAFVSRDGTVHPLIFEAVKAGVRIDIGRGGHMSYRAARAVLDAGIMPFTVGGDVHGYTIDRLQDGVWDGGYFDESTRGAAGPPTPIGGAKVYSLTQVMNELLALGIALEEVVRMVTCNAAAVLGMAAELGTLAPGAVADVTVLAMDHGRWTFSDSLGEELSSSMRLRPELTVRAGHVSRPDSPLLGRSMGRAA